MLRKLQKKKKDSSFGIFDIAVLGTVGLLALFYLAIIVSMAFYTDLNTFLSTLFSEEILFAIELSLITATLATVASILVTVPAAYALSRIDFRGKDVVDTLLDIPVVMPPVALGTAMLIFFSTPPGTFIQDNLVRFVFQAPGIVLAQFAVISSLAVRQIRAAFEGVSPKYEKAARALGCSKLQAFLKVTLPMAKKGLLAAFILVWARAIGEFGATITLAGATRMKTETLPVAIFLSLATADVAKAITIVSILIIISAAVLIFIRKIGGKIAI